MLLKSNIFRRLFLSFFTLSLIPLVITLTILLNREDINLQNQLHHQLEMTASSTKIQILQYLNYLKARTMDFASDGFIRDAVDELTEHTGDSRKIIQSLNKHLTVNKRPLIEESREIFVMNLSGQVIASSDSLRVGRDCSGTDYFLNGRDSVYVSDIMKEPETGEIIWVVAAPLKDKVNGELIGVLGNCVDPRSLSDVVTGRRAGKMGADIRFLRFGETGEIYIVNRDKQIITESRFQQDVIFNRTIDTEPVRFAIEQYQELSGNYLNYNGIQISGASRIIKTPYWIVLAEIDFSEALLPIKKLRSFALVLVGALLAGVFLITLILSSGFVKPIKKLKQTDEALQKSEKRYRSLVEGAPGIVHSHSDKRGGLYYSSRAESILGYSLSHLYKDPFLWYNSIHPDDRGKVDQITENFPAVKSFNIEYRIKDSHGAWHWFEDRSISMRKEQDEIIIESFATDITSRKKSEEELQRNYDVQKVINSLLNTSFESVSLQEILMQGLDSILSIPWLTVESQGSIFLVEEEPEVLIMRVQKGLTPACQQECARIPFGKCRCGQAAATGKIQFSSHIDKLHEIHYEDMISHGHYCIPILLGGTVLGVINIYLKEGFIRDENVEQFLTAIANTLAGIIIRKRNEEELIKLSTAVEQSADVVVITNKEGIIEYVNPVFEKLTGYKKEEVIGKTPAILKSGKHGDQFYSNLWHTILAGDVYRNILINKKKNGELYYSENTITPLKDNHNNILRFINTAKDITDRKRAENAIRESEERYRTLFEDSQDVVFISTPEGKFLDINPAGLALFGYTSKDELLNVSIAKDLYANPADRKKYIQVMEREGFVRDYELTVKSKDGGELIILETSTVLKDESGKITAYRGILRDKTRERELQGQLVQSQKMEAMGVLAGGIAHDFNNILTTILGNAQLGLMQMQPDNPLYKRFADIEKTAHKAAALTKQILAFSRRQPLEPRVIDINELITDFSKMLRRLIGEHIESDIVTTEKPCPVLADPNSLEQVLMNFAVNARDAMPDGGKFTITSERLIPDEKLRYRYPDLHSEEYVLITVSDTGTGIPEKILSRIFEPFFTTKETGKGTGLGLSVVHGIIKQHNGVIDVHSKLNQGTVFKIYLPITQSNPENKTEKAPGEIPRGSETVLIAEDELHLREMTVSVLQSLGYTVLSSKDGEEAVELFEQNKNKIDIVIMDIKMPRLGGKEAYRKIQEMRKDIHVLFISGYVGEIDEFLNAGENYVDFLPKPFTMESLGEKVREILDKNQKKHS